MGGICFGGYPFLPYVTPQGETSSNFGLPRELRVSWRMAGGASGFIYDETGITVQQPAAHSGVHFMPLGPVNTNELVLRLSDFPRPLMVHRGLSPDNRARERWGLFIPYFYVYGHRVYGHREQTRWSPRVPAALIATHQSPANLAAGYYPQADPQGRLRGLCPDQVRLTGGANPGYAVLSAASIFGPARVYGHSPVAEQEFFLSGNLNQGEQVRLFLEQATRLKAFRPSPSAPIRPKTNTAGDYSSRSTETYPLQTTQEYSDSYVPRHAASS